MQDQPNDSQTDTSNNSTKRLVKILVIIGIGIPVLVELMTLFNLINVNLFSRESDRPTKTESTIEERTYGEGDTLLADTGTPVVIDHLMIKVDATNWMMEMTLSQPVKETEFREVFVDSLKLESGSVIRAAAEQNWQGGETGIPRLKISRKLPNGDRPRSIYFSISQTPSGDTQQFTQYEIPLGNIPVRYSQDIN